MAQQFSAQLIGRGPNPAWTFLPIPFDVHASFGTRARIAVAGTINGAPFRSSLLPQGDGRHAMPVNQALQRASQAKAGDVVSVVMEVDLEPREPDIPADLADRLGLDAQLQARFARLSPSHKKEFAAWIESAKKEETRARRVGQALELLAAGKTPKG